MTKEDFSNLSPLEQEDFINNGGKISVVSSFSTDDKEQVGIGSKVSSSLDGVLHNSSPHSPSIESSLFSSTPSQPVQAFDDMGFDIKDPVELLFLLDENIQTGRVSLHLWQIQAMLDFAKEMWNDQHPFQAVVRACNGSGKDKYIIAPCIVWLCMRYRKALGVVTSSSGAQLDNQTCRYIKLLCEAANKKFGIEMWNVKYREYTLDFSILDNPVEPKPPAKSSIYCFATDEPKKAEGYHPTDFGTKMCIAASEDKSIPDEINVALNKCTGYTHRLHVSTPGLPMGHFYDYCSTAISRSSVDDITTLSAIDWIQYHVTAFDCSHISKAYIEQMKRDLPGGENGAAFKSQVLAEFGTTDEMVVIPYTYIWQSFTRKDIEWYQENFNTGGLDLSDGGDETVLVVRNGNKHLATIPFKFDNTEDTLAFLKEKFTEWNLNNKEALIFGDYGGIGSPMLKALKRSGWSNIRFIDSRSKAYQPNVYLNRGTELFFNVRKLFEQREIILKKDDLLVRQLSTRYYKINNKNIHQLLSKLEQKSKGYPSPDRADAFNLCFWNYKSTKIVTEEEQEASKPWKEEEQKKEVGDFTLKNWAEGSQRTWTANNGIKDFSSLEGEIEQYNRNIRLKQS